MDPALWSQIKDIAFEAMDRAPSERSGFLDSACGGRVEVRREVERLLRAHDSAEKGDFLDPPSIAASFSGVPRPAIGDGAMVGTRIGRYRVKRLIGTGGMGAVYEAVQEQPRRTVALKVMRSGLASASAMRRFEYEAQLLARLRHPGIAQVFEAGAHEGTDGIVPYFAMEYIPGAKALTEHVRGRGMGVRERLELFAHVCEAVHHGHQKGIVHRDLKPTNILVDSSGAPKIIDFGVARAADADLAMTTDQTAVGQLVGTLQYMSPEQCAADPNDIDTRSDIYSLGVVLYELLTGKPPYDLSGVPVYEAPRLIREQPPTRPSSIDAALKGDVSIIVLKALEKDRTQRYQSAMELAADIRRYLAGDAIGARAPSMAYQARLFARRHRPAVVGVAAVAAALVMGLAAAGLGFSRAVHERDRALAAETDAKAQAVRAARIADFLKATLASADLSLAIGPVAHQTLAADPGYSPWEMQMTGEWEYAGRPGHPATAVDLLRAAGQRLDGTFPDDPSIRGELAYLIGTILARHTAWGDARDLLRKAKRLQQQSGEPSSEAAVGTMLALAGCEGIMGDGAAAEEAYREATESCRRLFGRADPRTLEAGRQRTWNLVVSAGRRDEGVALQRETVAWLSRTLGPEDPSSLVELSHLAALLVHSAKAEEAETLARQATEGLRRVLGPERRPTVDAEAGLAFILRTRGGLPRLLEAERITRSAVAFYGSRMGTDYNVTNELRKAAVEQLTLLGRMDQAVPYARAMLESSSRIYGPDSISTVKAQSRLARVLAGAGTGLQEAEALARESAERTSRITSEREDYAVYHKATLAAVVRARGRADEALGMSEVLMKQILEPPARNAPWVRAYVAAVHGDCLLDLERLEEAHAALTEAVAQADEWGDPSNPIRVGAIRSMARLHQQLGNAEEAARWNAMLPSAAVTE